MKVLCNVNRLTNWLHKPRLRTYLHATSTVEATVDVLHGHDSPSFLQRSKEQDKVGPALHTCTCCSLALVACYVSDQRRQVLTVGLTNKKSELPTTAYHISSRATLHPICPFHALSKSQLRGPKRCWQSSLPVS